MDSDETVHDSPEAFVKRHITRYVESGGRDGATFNGVAVLLLTTRGRKTGKLRRTALYYGQDGDDYIVVASNGGSAEHPAWYLNLSENPEVEVQVGEEVFRATARTATGDERTRLWNVMTSVWGTYESYRKKAAREIPVVVLTPQR